ncbi:MAG: MlaD family protein [Thermodesulfobacteriaceae bacterium]|nr:MlaD family protein [Thermodesulfobacteriaceae bacterium]MDW8135900.1 MlaD family protein [Thermodesulfobacterium sp.]
MKGSTEIKVGIFVFLGILAIFYLTVKLAQEAFAPKDAYKLYAIFENVSGLTKGAKVEMAGVLIGKVGGIDLTSEGKAKVELLIYKKYKIQEDVRAAVRTFGVLGDKFVELKPGVSQNYLPEGGTIAYTESPVSVDEILAGLGPTIEGLKEILGTKEGKENLKLLVANIREASESFKTIAQKIEKGQGTLGKLVADDKLYQDLSETAKSLKVVAQQIEKGEGTLGKLVKDEEVYKTLKRTMANLESVSKKLEKGEGTLGKLISSDEIYKDLKTLSKDLRTTASSLDKIVKKIERGEGTLGKLVNDDSLYIEAKKTLRSVNRAAQGMEEQVPITILGTVAGAAMK